MSESFDLRAFQARIARTFGAKDAERGIAGTYMYFIEEVGELAEALREPDKQDLAGEFADVQAWLVSLAHLAGVDLATVTAAKYPETCQRCTQSPCVCATKP
jgi:NTP pyrophosphatase (non-canonical NTP hydrolase)